MNPLLVRSLLDGSQLLAEAFVAGLWQGMVLVGCAAVCLHLLRRAGATTRSTLCGLFFLMGIRLSSAHLFAEHGGLLPERPSAFVQLGAMWGLVVATAWAVLLLWRAAQLVQQGRALQRVWQSALPLEPSDEIRDLLRNCGRGRRTTLCISAEVNVPCVIGFFSPRLLLPEALHNVLAEQELLHIVLHECEHLRRGDDWINLLQKIAIVLFPLNPGLLWIDRRMSLERELACDAGVVLKTGEPVNYARCLTGLAERWLSSRSLVLSLSAWTRRSELAQRIFSLLEPVQSTNRWRTRATLFLLIVGSSAATVEMTKAPSLIAFGPTPSMVGHSIRVVAEAPAARDRMVSAAYRIQKSRPDATTQSPRMRLTQQRLNTRRVKTEVQQVSLRLAMKRSRAKLTTAARNARQPAYVLATEFSPRYAAVPFGNGWLVFQL